MKSRSFLNLILYPFILSIVFSFSISYSQTIGLDRYDFSIGESLEDVIAKIDTNIFIYALTENIEKGSSNEWHEVTYYNQAGSPNAVSATLSFCIKNTNSIIKTTPVGQILFPPSYKSNTKIFNKKLFIGSIQKIWADETVPVIEVFQRIYEIINKNGINQFDEEVSYEKNVEPNYTSYNITISTSSWHQIEISFSNNYLEINEIVTENEHPSIMDTKYYLIFNDYKHLNKEIDFIVEEFKKVKDAQVQEKKYMLPYIVSFLEPPSYWIVRNWGKKIK
ncbi:MAG: hypothetical protein P4L35_19800 [Ignavibacteriaceae bacterium]|nr:hypothetical protein [Ignavibacteriaceae bacterium]